jgi:cysteine-rich repeat protein
MWNRTAANVQPIRYMMWIFALHTGCLQEASQMCGNGSLCPPGLLCVDTVNTTTDSRICAAGSCGNGQPDQSEACDDGNNRSGDGCPADCTEPCGDGVRDPGEACDDSNTVDGDGCSGDCRSLDGIFRVSPPMVSFAAEEGGALPATVTVTVLLENRGDVHVGNVPGAQPPTWLSIAAVATTDTTAAFELGITDTSVAGPQSTSVRLLISHAHSARLDTFDLPVVYNVAPSALAVEAMPATLAFTAVQGDAMVPAQTVDVTFNGTSAALVSAPFWATVSTPPAPGTSPASFAISIGETSFLAGTEVAGDIVFRTTRGTVQRTASVHVMYKVFAPPALTIQTTPSSLAFTAIAGGAAPPAQAVSVTFSGTDVGMVSAPDWLTVATAASAPSSATFSIAVNGTSFAAGTQSGDVVFRTTRGTSQHTASVHVDYEVRSPPEVEFVGPYVGVAGRGNTVHIRGHGFASGGPVTVRIGALDIDPVVPDGDTQVTVAYPALPEGRYPVTLVDPPGVAPTSPELVVVAPSAFAYQAISAPSRRTRILFDAERGAIYGVNRIDQEIEHFAYADGSWSVRPPHVVPLLMDVAFAPDGRSLVVIDRRAVNEMSLVDGLFVPLQRAALRNNPSCGEHLTQSIAANNGKFLLVSDLSGCSGFSSTFLYDMRDRSLVHYLGLYNGMAGGSGDGSRIYTGSSSLSNESILMFDSLSSTSSPSVENFDLRSISISGDASRVIVNDYSVYSRSLRRTGGLPQRGVALASRDSNRAFLYVEDTAGPRLEIYDLNGPLQAGALYPLLRTVVLPDSANGLGSFHFPVVMTSSLDDGAVFVSGDSKLLVIPVN